LRDTDELALTTFAAWRVDISYTGGAGSDWDINIALKVKSQGQISPDIYSGVVANLELGERSEVLSSFLFLHFPPCPSLLSFLPSLLLEEGPLNPVRGRGAL